MSNITVKEVIESASLFAGYRVISDPSMTECIHEKIERNWFMQIVARIFKLKERKIRVVPSRSVVVVHDLILAHPSMIEEIRKAIKAEIAHAGSSRNSTKS